MGWLRTEQEQRFLGDGAEQAERLRQDAEIPEKVRHELGAVAGKAYGQRAMRYAANFTSENANVLPLPVRAG